MPEENKNTNVLDPNSTLALAIEKGLDTATIGKMLDLQERWEAMQAKKEFVRAMAAFKRECPAVIDKDKLVDIELRSGGRMTYKHATIGGIVTAITPALSKNGLHVSWETQQANNLVTVTCHVSHEGGHRESCTLSGPRDESGGKNPIQTVGSSVSYLERYTLVAVLGLATAEQDDADAREDERKQPLTPTTPKASGDIPPAKSAGDVAIGPVEDVRVIKGKEGKPDRYTITIAGVTASTLKKEHADTAKDAKVQGKKAEMAWLKNGAYINVASVNVSTEPAGPSATEQEAIEAKEREEEAKAKKERGELI